jgi:hypothetical protein
MKASVTYEHTDRQTCFNAILTENDRLFKNAESYGNVKIDSNGTGCGGMNWIHLAHDRNPRLDL